MLINNLIEIYWLDRVIKLAKLELFQVDLN